MKDEIFEKHRIQTREKLHSLGYHVNTPGYTYFEELVFSVRGLLNQGKTEDEIEKIMPNLITEYGSNYHEIGKIRYVNELYRFFEKRMPSDDDSIILNDDLVDNVIRFSKYLNGEEVKEEKIINHK